MQARELLNYRLKFLSAAGYMWIKLTWTWN